MRSNYVKERIKILVGDVLNTLERRPRLMTDTRRAVPKQALVPQPTSCIRSSFCRLSRYPGLPVSSKGMFTIHLLTFQFTKTLLPPGNGGSDGRFACLPWVISARAPRFVFALALALVSSACKWSGVLLLRREITPVQILGFANHIDGEGAGVVPS